VKGVATGHGIHILLADSTVCPCYVPPTHTTSFLLGVGSKNSHWVGLTLGLWFSFCLRFCLWFRFRFRFCFGLLWFPSSLHHHKKEEETQEEGGELHALSAGAGP